MYTCSLNRIIALLIPTRYFQQGRLEDEKNACKNDGKKSSPAGNRTRIARVRAAYPSQLDYRGFPSPIKKNDTSNSSQTPAWVWV